MTDGRRGGSTRPAPPCGGRERGESDVDTPGCLFPVPRPWTRHADVRTLCGARRARCRPSRARVSPQHAPDGRGRPRSGSNAAAHTPALPTPGGRTTAAVQGTVRNEESADAEPWTAARTRVRSRRDRPRPGHPRPRADVAARRQSRNAPAPAVPRAHHVPARGSDEKTALRARSAGRHRHRPGLQDDRHHRAHWRRRRLRHRDRAPYR